jgi:small-conductance mechanosensitive channel/CRP-like cAMP-binding protein
MNNQEFYRTLAVWVVAIIGGLLLYAAVRFLADRLFKKKGEGKRPVIARVALPFVFVLASFLVKEFGRLSSVFTPYVDAALIFFAFFFIIRLVDAAIYGWYTRTRKAFPLPDVLRSIALGVLYLIVLFGVLKYALNINITTVVATSAVLTMVIGLALQGVLSNILSGISLHFSRSITRGEWVSIGDKEGIVVDTNWRETRLQDRNSNIVILPNNIVAGETITNFAQPDARTALALHFRLSPEAPAQLVLDMLREAARDCPRVVSDPSPMATILEFDPYGVHYRIKFWVTDYGRKNGIVTDVGRLAWYKLRRHGIRAAVDLPDMLSGVLRGAAAPRPPEAPAADTDENFAVLTGSAFLRYQQGDKKGQLMAPEDDIRDLAAVVKRAVYAKGEVLCRQGDKGRSCYIVAKGLLRGDIITEENGKKYSNEFEIGPGGIFGEMSLFTGMPRTATGTVVEEAVLLKIQADDFGPVLAKNPDLAEVIAELVSTRNEQNKGFLLKIKELSEKDIHAGTNKKSILEYLKKFIGLGKSGT